MYRFVDRDMIMRYLWGLAVGHTYSHESTKRSISHDEPEEEDDVREVYNEEAIQDCVAPAHEGTERSVQDDEPRQEEEEDIGDDEDYRSELDADYLYDSTESLSEGDSDILFT
jgi:hypothetical protein